MDLLSLSVKRPRRDLVVTVKCSRWNLVVAENMLDRELPNYHKIIKGFSYVPGKKYADSTEYVNAMRAGAEKRSQE